MTIGVAVSGGGDSMAALHLMHWITAGAGRQVHAVTVDHGLRPEAAGEAAFVAQTCASLDIPHHTVRWEDWDGTGNLQDQARRARYALIADWAVHQGIGQVVLGHTVDDQAETFLMRLGRSAGVDGLSAMRARWEENGITWSRPFLNVTRQHLREFLTRHDLRWIEDPSNEDMRFDRVRARKAMEPLAALGISVEGLAEIAQHLAMARDALNQTASGFAAQHVEQVAGDLLMDRSALVQLPSELSRRVISGALRWISGADYAPRGSSIQSLQQAISGSKAHRATRTLGGCRIVVDRNRVRFGREAKAVADVTCASNEIWDNRWQLTGPHASGLTLRALGETGLKDCLNWRESGIPRASLLASPAVWKGERLIAAPLAGVNAGWQADLAPLRNNFVRFLISH